VGAYFEGKAGIPPLASSKLTGSLFVEKPWKQTIDNNVTLWQAELEGLSFRSRLGIIVRIRRRPNARKRHQNKHLDF